MINFKIINNVSEINLSDEWVDSACFKSMVVDEKGNTPSASSGSQRYRLIAEKERKISCLKQFARGFLGTLIVICSLGIALFFESTKNLFAKKCENLRFGIPIPRDPFIFLPKVIHQMTLSYLDSVELGRCLRVNKEWYSLANHEALWKALPLPAMAFGKKAWAIHFGDVGEEPFLPRNIHKILKSPCPFWPEKKVEDTHMLTLIPETVDGKPLTLNALEEFIKKPKEGTGTSFGFLWRWGRVTFEYGDKLACKAHWVLMTKEVLAGSRGRNYMDQKKIVNELVEKMKMAYEIPNALDAVISILMKYVSSQELLFSNKPRTYIRCQEKIEERMHNSDGHVIIGDFTSEEGLNILATFHNPPEVGIAVLRKF